MTSSFFVAIFLASTGVSALQASDETPHKTDNKLLFEQAVLYFSGASCIEDLDQDELEHYELLYERPLDINHSNKSKLLSSGLFSNYQAASLVEYRNLSGDILSLSELALIDGFSAEFVQALRLFIILRSNTAPGQKEELKLRQSITGAFSYRDSDDKHTKKLKYTAELGSKAEFRWTTRTTYSAPELKAGTFSAAYYGKRYLGKLVLGHFAARFGQGLAMWSGFSMSSYSSASSFYKNSGGFAATGSASPELLGVASEWNLGRFSFSGGYSFLGNRVISNLSWTGRHVSFGMTATESSASVDWRISLPNISIFGELCSSYAAEICGVGGMIWIPKYGHKLALQGRWYDKSYSSYSGIAAGYESFWMIITADAAERKDTGVRQFKSLVLLKPSLNISKLAITPKLRWSGRFRPTDKYPLRNDLRGDIEFEWKGWIAAGRYNLLWCRELGWLWYAQAGRKTQNYSFSIRGGLFRIDNWDDRIYVYQQDAPGNFNVPAFYGRGWNVSLYASMHLGRQHSLWLRVENIRYPWNLTPKDGKMEFKLQYRWKT